MIMPHKVEISDKTYDRLKEFCDLNDLKIGQLADKLIYDGLMIEMYGDVPFTNYKRKIKEEFPPEKFEQEYLAQPEPIKIVEAPQVNPEETTAYWVKKEMEKEMEETLKIPKEVFNQEKRDETLKEAGVPTKVVNKITKRRLK